MNIEELYNKLSKVRPTKNYFEVLKALALFVRGIIAICLYFILVITIVILFVPSLGHSEKLWNFFNPYILKVMEFKDIYSQDDDMY